MTRHYRPTARLLSPLQRNTAVYDGQADAAIDLAGCHTAADADRLSGIAHGNLTDTAYDRAYLLGYDSTLTAASRARRGPASLREIEQQPCPGYLDPFTGKRHHRDGQTHRLSNSRRGVRCICDADEPTLRSQAEAAR